MASGAIMLKDSSPTLLVRCLEISCRCEDRRIRIDASNVDTRYCIWNPVCRVTGTHLHRRVVVDLLTACISSQFALTSQRPQIGDQVQSILVRLGGRSVEHP